MTDEAYTFVKDIRDKKSVAASAFRRNPGHRGCKLPYEAIPYAERHKLNGEVKTMNIDRPMKWDEFKALPDDIKKKYITRLRELYHANYKDIAEMLGTGQGISIRSQMVSGSTAMGKMGRSREIG